MRAGIALGSNIEPRLAHLQAAAHKLRDLHGDQGPVLWSRIYETAPVDCPDGSQPFLNAIMEISVLLSPEALLRQLKEIEFTVGRRPNPVRNAPRIIDLDLLYCDNLAHSDSELILPHSRLAERRFVLQPLSDIRTDLVLPQFGRSIGQLLQDLPQGNEVNTIKDTLF